MGIDYLTKGQKVVGITDLRKRMNSAGPQQTNIYDAKAGVESYRAIRGRKPLRYFVKSRIADVKTAARAGKYIHVCVNYGVLNQLLIKTGDPNFTGGHSFGILGQKTLANGKVRWLLWDPLDDQRRRGIPKGPRWVSREAVVAAMEAFAGGKGRCYAGVFGGGQKK
jgi:hypothetical protein